MAPYTVHGTHVPMYALLYSTCVPQHKILDILLYLPFGHTPPKKVGGAQDSISIFIMHQKNTVRVHFFIVIHPHTLL